MSVLVTRLVILTLFCLTWFSGASLALAEVRLPNGEYTETNNDLTVKVLGGYVTVARSWTNGRWYINPTWANLRFEQDNLDQSVIAIDRAGAIYQRLGNGVYIFDNRFFIKSTATGWRWYDQQGNWITYDASGHLTAYGDRNNVQVSFQLDANGNPAQVLDHLGNLVLTLQYAGGQVTSITDRTGRQVRYQYTGADLTQVTDVLGNPWIYTYDSNGQLTSRTDPEGHTTRIAYSPSTPAGLLIVAPTGVTITGPIVSDYRIAPVFTVTDPEGNVTSYAYDYDRTPQRYTVIQTFPTGRRVTSVYYNDGKLAQQTVGSRVVYTMTRDGDSIEMVADERGLVTRNVYDGARNPLQITYPDGTSVSTTYDSAYSNPLSRTDEAGTKILYEYDSHGNLLKMTEAVGLPEQRVTTYTYDQYGQRLTMTRKGLTPAEDATTVYTYDAYGNVATVTDTVGNLAAATYDVMGNPLTITDTRNNAWSRTYNGNGWLLTASDPLGHTTTSTYDKVGNQTKVTDASNNSTIFAYNKNEWLISVTDALSGVTQYQYDGEGRGTKIIDPNNVTMTYGYDGDGRWTSVTDGNGNVTRTVYGDASSGLNGLVAAKIYPTYTDRYKYDPRNRVTQTIQVLDANTSYTSSVGYDSVGNVVSRTDALGRATQFVYDSLNRQTRATDAVAGLTQYAYDARDNLIAVTDANSNTTRYGYDRANRMTSETRPLTATTQYAYDGNGNLTSRTNAKGEQRRFTYDTANRRTQEQQFAVTGGVLDSSPSRIITFGYDARNLLTSYGDGTTSATYGYDAKGQKTLETVNYGSFSKTIQYGYQANGKKASFTFPDNAAVAYTYDGNNQLKTITTAQGTISYGAYQWSVPTQVSEPGVTRIMTYDPLLRPTEIKAQAIGSGTPANPQGLVLMDYHYTYDAASNIVQRQTQDGLYAYQYDNLNRLTSAVPPVALQVGTSNPNGLPVEAYSYDGVHNRLTSAHQLGPWIYNGNDELLSYGQASSQVTFQYDANGHTVQRIENGQTQNLGYDVAERLTTIGDGAGNTIASYYYDPLGRRVTKRVGTVVTDFQYADEGLIAEYDGGGNVIRSYGWRPNSTWSANPQFLITAGAIYFYHNDRVGTPQQLTSPSGSLMWSARAEAFGRTVVDVSSATVDNPLRFPGQYYDAESTLHYNYYRDYNPQTGRYLESDPIAGRFIRESPIGVSEGIDLYAYVGNNPTDLIDPTGLSGQCIGWTYDPKSNTTICTVHAPDEPGLLQPGPTPIGLQPPPMPPPTGGMPPTGGGPSQGPPPQGLPPQGLPPQGLPGGLHPIGGRTHSKFYDCANRCWKLIDWNMVHDCLEGCESCFGSPFTGGGVRG